MIGEIIGNFRVTGRLGKGGMGDVWLGEHKEIKTKVAIKVLAEDISTDRQQVDRFFNEAVAVSRIKHSGIVKIFDSGYHASGRAYLIMELLEGESLGARVKRVGRLPLAQLADFGRQIASVLEATHAEGIIHRDLKPDNVFLIKDAELAGERVKLLDFGIAKLADATGMTGTGGAMGTPSYMPPEQWKASGKVSARADSYAFGCLAFEAACGRPPFVATSVGEACNMHLHETPPAAKTIVGTLPDALDALLARLLAKDPDQRPAMSEVKAVFATLDGGRVALDATMPGASTSLPTVPATTLPLDTTLGAGAGVVNTDPQPRPQRSKLPLVFAAGGLAIAGVVAFVVLRGRGESSPDPAPAATATASENPFIVIEPPPTRVVLGVAADAPEWVRGFRPARGIVAPLERFEIQEHEVTWAELDPWLVKHRDAKIEIPAWAKDEKTRARLPVAGVAWGTARDYCKTEHNGTLPKEEQWEYAARGAERRPNPWGDARLDLEHTRAFVSDARATPRAVLASDQDVTPNGVHDLAGNVQEWTSDLWRGDATSVDDHKSQDLATQTTIRAIRGLTMVGPPPPRPADAPPANDSAAFREPLCATGKCDEAAKQRLAYVGFRCVRAARR